MKSTFVAPTDTQTVAGIYVIINEVSDQWYVGQSISIRQRWQTHLSALESGTHQNAYLQNAWYKYGPGAFRFVVLEQTEPVKAILDAREAHWYSVLKPTYNLVIPLESGGHRRFDGRAPVWQDATPGARWETKLVQALPQGWQMAKRSDGWHLQRLIDGTAFWLDAHGPTRRRSQLIRWHRSPLSNQTTTRQIQH